MQDFKLPDGELSAGAIVEIVDIPAAAGAATARKTSESDVAGAAGATGVSETAGAPVIEIVSRPAIGSDSNQQSAMAQELDQQPAMDSGSGSDRRSQPQSAAALESGPNQRSSPRLLDGVGAGFRFGQNEAAASDGPGVDGTSESLYGDYAKWGAEANGGKGWIILDAGHGGSDPGSIEKGVSEKDVALKVTLRAAELLRESDADYILTRDEDTTVPVDERIRLANSVSAAFLVSVHCDWFEDGRISGATTLYCNSAAGGAPDEAGKALAAIIQARLTEDLGVADRGVNPNDHILVLRKTIIPSALVELAFLSNSADRKLLNSEAFQERAAQNLASGILDALAAAPKK
ncbi:MAG: N-acetylmuramoyl-L-alanine amidase [Clostridiales bacterium]|nr:N-acetylmuramoyl-L-alanine amidase [Clostridiales bacterium]